MKDSNIPYGNPNIIYNNFKKIIHMLVKIEKNIDLTNLILLLVKWNPFQV